MFPSWSLQSFVWSGHIPVPAVPSSRGARPRDATSRRATGTEGTSNAKGSMQTGPGRTSLANRADDHLGRICDSRDGTCRPSRDHGGTEAVRGRVSQTKDAEKGEPQEDGGDPTIGHQTLQKCVAFRPLVRSC